MMRNAAVLAFALLLALPVAALPEGDPPDGPGEGSCLESGCHGDLTEQATVHAPVEGEMCEACHASTGQGHGYSLVSDEIGEVCTTCHDDPTASMATVHAPAAAGECTVCHNPHGSDQEFMLTSPTGELCSLCHGDPTEGMESVHPPVAAGECTICHSPHGSAQEFMLTSPAEELCTLCHEAPEVPEGTDLMVHMPAAEGMCTSCHTPHGSEHAPLLRDVPKEVCLACHDGIGEQLGLTSTHGVIDSFGCHACHDPHGPAGATLLRAAGIGLCLSCHGAAAGAGGDEESAGAKLISEIGMDAERLAAIPKIPLNGIKGHPSVRHPVSAASDPRNPDSPFWCGSCHQPHGSETRKLLRGGEGMRLCMKCHKK